MATATRAKAYGWKRGTVEIYCVDGTYRAEKALVKDKLAVHKGRFRNVFESWCVTSTTTGRRVLGVRTRHAAQRCAEVMLRFADAFAQTEATAIVGHLPRWVGRWARQCSIARDYVAPELTIPECCALCGATAPPFADGTPAPIVADWVEENSGQEAGRLFRLLFVD
jgi:hypothetical protein